MSLPRSVAECPQEHVTLEVEGIDRMYLNVYVPQLQRERGVVAFFRFHRGDPFASSALMDPISKAFIPAIEAFASARARPADHLRQGAAQGRRHRRSTWPSSRPRKASSSWARPRRRRRSSAPRSAATRRPARPIPGSSGPRPWSTTTTSTAVDRGLRPVLPQVLLLLPLQRQALPQRPRVRQAATGQAGDRLRGAGQRHPARVPIPGGCRRSATASRPARSTRLLRKWLRRLPHPFTAAIAGPATATTCRSSRPSSR